MKKHIIIIAAALLAFNAGLGAQDARQRTVPTIVSDVLASLPAQNAADFKREIADLANNAPESVVILCDMLKPAQDKCNSLVEFAIGGLTNYATDPANASCLPKVKQGFIQSLTNCNDIYNIQFLVAQLRLLSPENAPAAAAPETADALMAKYNELSASKKSNERCNALWCLAQAKGAEAADTFVAALSDPDRDYRMAALKNGYAAAGDAFTKAVVKKYPKLGADAKTDVMSFIADHAWQGQDALILKEIKQKGQLGRNAIIAAGKLGGDKAADALISKLVDAENGEVAEQALYSFNGNIAPKVAKAIKGAKGEKLCKLLRIAGRRHIDEAAPAVYAAVSSSDAAVRKAAATALPGVVELGDAEKLAALLDNATENVEAYTSALNSAIRKLNPKEKYETVSAFIKSAKNPGRFYDALATSGTDAATNDLVALCKAGDKDAVSALCRIDNYKAASELFELGKTDEACLLRYVSLVQTYEKNIDKKCEKLIQALGFTKNDKQKIAIVKSLASLPTMKSFLTAGKYLDCKNAKLSYAAAETARKVAGSTKDDIDYASLTDILGRCKEIYKSTGNVDDGYSIDEINTILSNARPSETNALTEEEIAQGFELLFDGKTLDKWTGDKEGYTPVNGTIYVTAGYGDARNLYTVKEYRDFVFRFEFCFVRPGVNNGVGIRTPMGKDAAYWGMCESQILDHDDPIYKNLREYQVHGSVYGVVPARRIVHKPIGEWSTEEIRVEGDRIKVTVNGEVIVDCNVREACQGHNMAPDGSNVNPYTVDHRNHPGMFNERGHVGFLGPGAGVKFKNVRILDLEK